MNHLTKLSATLLLLLICVHQAQPKEQTDLEEQIERLENNINQLKRLRISGNIQTQFEWGEKDASLGVGAPNENPEESFSRFGIRRGRVGFVFRDRGVLANFQLDMTERSVNVRNAFLQLNDPLLGVNALRAGLFTLPFGYELGYSSALRESPERSAIVQHLFPGVRDVGAAFTFRAPSNSPWHVLRLDAGFFAGNGRNIATDSRMDFTGRLSAEKNIGILRLSGGLSYYHGGVFQGTTTVYTMVGNRFERNSSTDNIGRFAKREYFGADLQLIVSNNWGRTKIMTEYIFGQQPGSEFSSQSRNAGTRPNHDTFIRPIRGGYAMLVQDLGRLPLSAVLKFDWYNPNTAVSGSDIGLNNTGTADLMRTAYGFGLLWNVMNNVRMTVYYEMVRMETNSIANHHFRGDSFTLRLQYRF